ncbi:glycosyl transferase [Aldersonia sp. NBC_00410]|uniref:glycosyl transferase n=1 Tax=Aldersonia sp. NBC_00410 TaxID=2975954 RepID=UPI002250AB65|nr:glycosyl transferase [Aldersonia sp. NBC_00410]MCX5042229.1 glycosyl transferase [Aldersonia sp. NBC_00410]
MREQEAVAEPLATLPDAAVNAVVAAPVVTTAPKLAPRRTREKLRRWWNLDRADAIAALTYLALAVFVLHRQWRHLHSGYLVKSGQDQTMWEWFFAVTAHSVAHLDNPLGTTLQNHPLGVNMMANTAMFGVSIPLAPLTWAFGPTMTYVLVLTVGLFGTAMAWYWLFSRELVDSRLAAGVGGVFCGFAPAMVSHANAHPNFVVLFLLPITALLLIRISRRTPTLRSVLRDGTLLGVLMAAQILLGEEPLLLFAMGLGLFALVYHAHRPISGLSALLRVAAPVSLAAVLALAFTVVPLWWQFLGPQSYRFIDHGQMGNDLKTLIQFPSESIGGLLLPGQNVAINPTEENAYFGWPLLGFIAILAVWLWRNRVARAATVTVLVMGVISLGAELTIGERATGIELPWLWLGKYPLLESVLETRFAMACIPAIAVLLALAVDRGLRSGYLAVPVFIGLAVALVPLAPTPLPVVSRSATPEFFTDGSWQQFSSGGSVVTVPLPRPEDATALRWQHDAGFAYPIAGGYFVGPAGAEKKGKYGPDDRPTALLLARIASTGTVPPIDEQTKATARADLRFWQADMVVLPQTQNRQVLQSALTDLLGFEGERVEGVRVWDVRGLR